MEKNSALAIITILMGILFAFSACKPSTDTGIEESFREIKKVTPISGVDIESMEINKKDNQDNFLTVQLNDGVEREAWCIEWNEEQAFGIQNGASLYSTSSHEDWKELNYFMSIKDDLRADDPELTAREIQVIIWSLIDNPSFDVDKISEYEEIDPRIYKDGQPLFDVQKVKDIVSRVKTDLASLKNKKKNSRKPGLTVIENDGQTIITTNETAYAVKTQTVNGQTIADNNYSSCFDEEILPGVSFNKWGWTNGKLSDSSGDLTYDIYAGAGQCDLNKGTPVGELIVNYSNGTLTVTYKMTESGFTGSLYTLTETHLYAGSEPYASNKGNGKPTVAPGQYGNKENHNDITEYTYEINGLSGDIYFIAHAVVNGFNPNAD